MIQRVRLLSQRLGGVVRGRPTAAGDVLLDILPACDALAVAGAATDG